MSRIGITGLRAVGFHGVFDEERKQGQEFVVDVLLDVDTATAERSDNLADSVDYGAVANIVYGIITGPPFNLIESLAGHIADVLNGLEQVRSVEVTVHKPEAPITVAFEDVFVRVTRP